MDLYMRALGFSRMDSKAEAEFIQEGIKECIDEGLVLKNQKLNRGSMVVAAGESMGVYIYGRYEENRFVYDPFEELAETSAEKSLTINGIWIRSRLQQSVMRQRQGLR